MCTNLMIKGSKGQVVSARTMDFGIKFDVNLVKVPQKDDHFGFVAVRQLPRWLDEKLGITTDGMNEKGLSGALLWLPCTEYPFDEEGIFFGEFIDYVLGRYDSVTKLLEDINSGTVHVVNKIPLLNKLAPTHFIFTDTSGKSLIVEFEDNQMKTYTPKNGVMTNAPFYPEQLENLANYSGLTFRNTDQTICANHHAAQETNGSGMIGLPGDATPKSRFVKASKFSEVNVPDDSTQADMVTQAWQVLETFQVPIGTIIKMNKDENADYTQWCVVREHAGFGEINYYYYSMNNPTLNKIAMDKVNWAKDEVSVPIAQGEWFTDRTAEFK